MNGPKPTLAELIAAAAQSRAEQIEISMPGVIVDYDAATQTATVQPGLRRPVFTVDGDRDAEEIKPLQNVKVIFPRSTKLSIHFRLVKGDGVHLICTTRSINEWRQMSLPGIATPGETRTHVLANAVCYPGFYPDAAPGPDADESIGITGSASSRFHFFDDHIAAGGGANFAALANLVATEFTKIKTALSTLTVTSGAGSGGLVAAGTPYTTVGSVASSNLKAD